MSNLVLINGEEEFLKYRAAYDEARNSLVDSICEFDAADVKDYLEESQIPSLFGGTRAFIIWGAKDIPPLPVEENDILIVVAKKKIKSKEAKRSHSFSKLKTYDDNNQVVSWILQEGEILNIDLSRVATALFVSNEGSLRKIASEIRKLAVLTAPGDIVEPAVAKSVMCFSADLTPKRIIESICRGQTTRALAFYDKLQEKADETGWIIAFLQRHVLQHLLLEKISAQKISPDQASSIIGIHPFLYKKMLVPHIGLWSQSSLSSSLDRLCDLDIFHKRGNPTARMGLQLEIIQLSEEARNGE